MRSLVRSMAVVAALSLIVIGVEGAQAQTAPASSGVEPNQIYIDGFAPGWSLSGWAKNTPQKPIDNGMRPILVQMQGWANIGFKPDKPISIKAYKTFTFAAFLDGHGKQEINVILRNKGQDVSRKLVLKGPKQQWFEIDQAVADLHVTGDGTFDEIQFSNPGGDAQEDFYIDNVALQ